MYAEAFSEDRNQHINAEGDPDLGLHRVLVGAEKCLDAQMLLDPFEQQGDILPINIVPMKLRSTIDFIRCAGTACQ